MTDQQIAALERRIESLETQLAHERAERSALPKILIPAAAETERRVGALERDFDLTRAATDERLGEVADQARAGGQALEVLRHLIATLKALPAPDAGRGEFDSITLEILQSLVERQERVETLLGPILRGEARLMAERV
jgi:hypothetical protein